MGYYARKPIVTDGLVFSVDAENNKICDNITNVKNIITPTVAGTFINGASVVDGYYQFDGINDYIEFLNTGIQQIETDLFTIEVVVRFDNLSSIGPIIQLGNGEGAWNIFRNGVNNIWLRAGTGVNEQEKRWTGLGLVAGQIYHLVFTYDGSNSVVGHNIHINTIFKNGSNSSEATRSVTPPNDIIRLGFNVVSGSARYLAGGIKYAKKYSRILTTDEIIQNYNALKDRFI